tara:strand:+ start:1017 stop:2138 length:1122 start_codon:yes stop_codon:yes gene_type:complete
MGKSYKDTGVNIKLGDKVSEMLYEAARQTWVNREGNVGEVVELFPDFSGLRAVNVGGLPEGTYMNLGFDGIGTKVQVVQRMRKYDTVARDLFAMVCDDAVVRGAEPIMIGSILDVNSLGPDKAPFIEEVRELATGYISAAKAANVAVVNGEIAEISACVGGYGDFCFNWGAACVWMGTKDKLLTGNEIKVGDYLVGFHEYGLRSNGLSLVRDTMLEYYGDLWHQKIVDGESLGDTVLIPSTIYTKAVVDMLGGAFGEPKVDVHGVAHITGGGLPGKVGRMLKPSGFGADISSPCGPCYVMNACQELAGTTDEEAYRTFNMGQGMVIATPDPADVISIAREHDIDADTIGQVSRNPGIRIKSKGIFRDSEWLEF